MFAFQVKQFLLYVTPQHCPYYVIYCPATQELLVGTERALCGARVQIAARVCDTHARSTVTAYIVYKLC